MVITNSDCFACRHLRLSPAGGLACAAFPRAIPADLLEGRAQHRQPYPGDNGVRFQPDPDAPADALEELAAVA